MNLRISLKSSATNGRFAGARVVEDRPFTAQPRFVGFELGEAFLARCRRRSKAGMHGRFGAFHKWRGSPKCWFMMGHPLKMDALRGTGIPPFMARTKLTANMTKTSGSSNKKDPKSVPSILTP